MQLVATVSGSMGYTGLAKKFVRVFPCDPIKAFVQKAFEAQ